MLYYYSNNLDDKEHIALVKGNVSLRKGVVARVHSECFTGDVIGSRRCDCGDQLHKAMQMIGRSDCGVLIYLRQEGRGIGLLEKLKAYNLQDQGLDTVDANIRLGHRPDEREYSFASLILKDLQILSVRLITNNPNKINELSALGIQVDERIPVEIDFHEHNREYLKTKAKKMDHLLNVDVDCSDPAQFDFLHPLLKQLRDRNDGHNKRMFITLSFAQSIDGSVAFNRSHGCPLSCRQSLEMTHLLRARHSALLVGVNTIRVDDPKLTVRFANGNNPQPVILDSKLCIPTNAHILNDRHRRPIIITTDRAPPDKKVFLEKLGARVYTVNKTLEGKVELVEAVDLLRSMNFSTLMVEGGASVINQFLSCQLIDYCIITLAPKLIGGLKAVEDLICPDHPSPLSIIDCQYHRLGSDLIVFGAPSGP